MTPEEPRGGPWGESRAALSSVGTGLGQAAAARGSSRAESRGGEDRGARGLGLRPVEEAAPPFPEAAIAAPLGPARGRRARVAPLGLNGRRSLAVLA